MPWVPEGSLAGNLWVGFRSIFGKTWLPNPSRTTGLVLQCRSHQKLAQPWRQQIPARLPSGTQMPDLGWGMFQAAYLKKHNGDFPVRMQTLTDEVQPGAGPLVPATTPVQEPLAASARTTSKHARSDRRASKIPNEACPPQMGPMNFVPIHLARANTTPAFIFLRHQ